MANRRKKQSPKFDDAHRQEPAEDGGALQNEPTRPGQADAGSTLHSDDDRTDAKTRLSADDSSDIENRTSPDSIEGQDGDLDNTGGYGEEYYYDGSAHPAADATQKEGEMKDKGPTESSAPTEKAAAAGGGKNGDDDDDDDAIEDGNPEKKMPFLDHLEELRWTLLRSLLAIVIGSIICFIFNEKIIQALRWVAPANMQLVILAPTEGFMISVKVALFAGLVLALPFVAYEFWKFIVPGLLAKEKKLVPPIVFFTVICFLIGGAFAYFFILRFALQFLLNFQAHTENMIAIGKYLGFVVTLILVFGVVFELPVMAFFLSKIGLLTPEFLRSKRRYGIVVIFIVAAVLTPPDVMTQLMLAGPLIVLYEISIWVSAAAIKKNREQEEEEFSG